MKHLMTLVALLVSTAAVAQIPTLPWNPDGNDDQFIGMPDLLDLLTVYGQEFENAIVAEDGESAIMYMGDMGYPQCQYACENLPGFWTMPKAFELTPVLGEIQGSGENTWLKTKMEPTSDPYSTYAYAAYFDGTYLRYSTFIIMSNRCYCTAKQLPRVEYDYLDTFGMTPSQFSDAATDKASEGWYLIETDQQGRTYFWRFAQ